MAVPLPPPLPHKNKGDKVTKFLSIFNYRPICLSLCALFFFSVFLWDLIFSPSAPSSGECFSGSSFCILFAWSLDLKFRDKSCYQNWEKIFIFLQFRWTECFVCSHFLPLHLPFGWGLRLTGYSFLRLSYSNCSF